MKHISKFIDTNLLDAEIKRLEEIRLDLKRKSAMYRTRIYRLKKIHNTLVQGDLFDESKPG